MIVGHHGKALMLLKKESKPSDAGFRRKRLDILDTYAEIKGKVTK